MSRQQTSTEAAAERPEKSLESPHRAEQAAHEFEIGTLRDLIDAEFDCIDPEWRRKRGVDGHVTGITYTSVRRGGVLDNAVTGAGDREADYLVAMRRAIDEYARRRVGGAHAP